MYYPRRSFLRKISSLSAASALLPVLLPQSSLKIKSIVDSKLELRPKDIAEDDLFWAEIRKMYKVSDQFVNLENGYYSLAAEPVLNAQERHNRVINQVPSYYMRRQQFEDYAKVKTALAKFAGCSPEEMTICRNTTEALNTVIMGLQMNPGDEAIMTNQDYGSMLAAFEQRSRRDKIINKIISLPLHPKNDREIVSAYERAITDRTKVILVTHVINITGQVLPVKKIAEMAHAHGVEVISDSAHALGHLDFKVQELGCDYFGTSLHKWVGAPLGTGMMYIRKDKISKVWPLMGDDTFADNDIRKFEHLGTRPCGINLSILDALEFQETLGVARKQARLRYLKKYWVNQVKNVPGITINTAHEEHRSSAIANVGVKNLPPVSLANRLFDKYKIFTVAIDMEAVKGVRITPHLYTSTEDLDQLVVALKEISRS